jgi:hypothetical protein
MSTHIKLPLPANWREMRAKDLFDLNRPLLDQLPPPDQLPPELRRMVEQAKRHPIPEIVLRNAQLAMEKGPASWLDLPISMVASATETKTYPTTVGEVLEGIRAGKWEKIVKRVRDRHAKAFKDAEEEGKPDPAVAAKKAANSLKLKMPAVTWSGAFSERVDSAIETHSGFLCIDADNCAEPASTRAKLAADPYVQAAFISPTGTGCKALVRIPADANSHARGFAAARKHFNEAHGIAIDEACKTFPAFATWPTTPALSSDAKMPNSWSRCPKNSRKRQRRPKRPRATSKA